MRSATRQQLQFPARPRAIARLPRIRDRIAARLRAGQLDLALAAGVSPEATPALALRARRLTSLPHRRALAESYRRVVREAGQDRGSAGFRIVPCRGRVTAAGEALNRLADRLAQPGPVAAEGAAMALLLLTDGTGPLYNAGSRNDLGAHAADATEELGLHEM